MNRDSSRPIIAAARLVVAWSVIGVAILLGPAGSGRFTVSPGDHNGYLADLQQQVPPGPGVDGRLGTGQDPKVEVPTTGVTDGKGVLDLGQAGAVEGIPSGVLPAYQRAAADLAKTHPGCGLTWPLLAGIGKVESAHASGGRVDARGQTRGRILGPVLDGGPGEAAISDTDGGRMDGDARWDRAVGPMQFIPGTWATFGTDGNTDGVADPHNIYDAARSAGEYLCSGGANLTDSRGLVAAVLRYNHSMDYVSTVLRWMQLYSTKGVQVPDLGGKVTDPDDDGNAERVTDPTKVPDTDTDEDNSDTGGDTGSDNDTDTRTDGRVEDDLVIGKQRIERTPQPTPTRSPEPSPEPTPSEPSEPTASVAPTMPPTTTLPRPTPTKSTPTPTKSPNWSSTPGGRPSTPDSPSPSEPTTSPDTTPTTSPDTTPTATPCPSPSPSETPLPEPTPTGTPSAPSTCATQEGEDKDGKEPVATTSDDTSGKPSGDTSGDKSGDGEGSGTTTGTVASTPAKTQNRRRIVRRAAR